MKHDEMMRPTGQRSEGESGPAVPSAALREVAPARSVATSRYVRYLKPAIDVAVAGSLMIATAPIQAVVAAGVRLNHGAPVIYRQRRVGRDGRTFVMLKFKSMRDAVDEATITPNYHTNHDDPRHTRFGTFIRRFSLDELPQLINVLRGEMSMIGPRPELPEVCAAFDLFDHPRHSVRPGLTGAWQVSPSRHTFVHLNTHLDDEYVERVSFLHDWSIAMKTIGVLIVGKKRPRLSQDDARELLDRGRPLRVLHVLEPSIAGVPGYVDRLGRLLSVRGIEQVVICNADADFDFEEWATDVIRVPWNRKRPEHTLAVAETISRLADAHEIDIVHAHATFAGLAARLRSHPARIVYQPHGWGHLSTERRLARSVIGRVEAVLAKRTDVLLTLSRHEVDDAPPARRRESIGPIPDIATFAPPVVAERRRTRAELGWGTEERIHLCVGEYSTRKNQKELVREWLRVAPVGHRLVLIGDGGTSPDIPAAERSRISELGWRDDIPRLMQAADSLVISSKGEGFSLVILEALATGLPVFTTDIGGAEAVEHIDGVVERSVRQVVYSAVRSKLVGPTQIERIERSKRHRTSKGVIGDEVARLYQSLFPMRAELLDEENGAVNERSGARPAMI